MYDMLLAVLLIAQAAICVAAGWQLCTSRHRQRGLEVDRYWDTPADLWPGGTPAGIDWDRELQDLGV